MDTSENQLEEQVEKYLDQCLAYSDYQEKSKSLKTISKALKELFQLTESKSLFVICIC